MKCVTHSKTDNIEIMFNYKTDKGIEEFFQSRLSEYQIGLETSIRDGHFIFDYVYLLYYKSHKINFRLGGPYIDFLDSKKKTKQQLILSTKKIINAFNTL